MARIDEDWRYTFVELLFNSFRYEKEDSPVGCCNCVVGPVIMFVSYLPHLLKGSQRAARS
jgi:hypothetical protein